MAHIKERVTKQGNLTHVVCWRDPEGRFREKSFRLIKDARAHKSRVEADLSRGITVDDRKARLTFDQVADEWLESGDTSKRTEAARRQTLAARVSPVFGHRRIGTITASDCAAYKNQLKSEGLRPATIRKVFGLVNSVLGYAVKARYIPANPAALVRMPTEKSMNVAKSQPRYLTPYQLEELITACATFHPDYGLLVRFLAMTGLRVGEAAALHIEDVRVWNGKAQITVTKTYDPRYGLSNAPKTSRSNRVVEVLPQLVPQLEEYLARHPRRADSNAPFWMGRRQGGTYMTDWSPISRGTIAMLTDEQRALLNKHHGPIDEIRPFDPERRWDPMVFTKHVWRRAVGMARLDRASSVGLRAAEPMLVVRDENERQWDSDYPLSQRLTRDPDDPKLSLRMHDLRHTAASIMLTAGVPLIVVSRQLGHSSVATTDKVYGGWQRSTVESAMQQVNDWYAMQQAETAANVTSIR